MELNREIITHRLQFCDRCTALASYIYSVQGNALRRLDFKKAAEALKVSERTIKRYCDKLADKKVILFKGDGLQLNPDIIEAG